MQAIVLNKIKYSDNSFIVNLYSLNHGRFACIVRFSKTKKINTNHNLFFPLNIIDTEVNFRNSRNIQTLKNINSAIVLNQICSNINKICIAQFIAEVISKTIKEEEENSNLYNFIKETILLLENSNNNDVNKLHLIFLKEFAKFLGFAITNNFCKETPYFNFKEGMFLPLYTTDSESLEIDRGKILSNILDINYNNISTSKISYTEKKLLLQYLLKYYDFHIVTFGNLKSIKVLNELFYDINV